jgi:N-carbamoyl-L-amino-acid hydrolase
VVLGLELRDLDAAKIQMLFDEIHVESQQIGQATGTQFGFKPVDDIVPEPTNPGFRKIIEESAKQLGLTTHMMPSGAGHDAQEIARICPVGMIFIPSIGGISHSPKEFSSPEDMTNGANVLLLSFLRLDEK